MDCHHELQQASYVIAYSSPCPAALPALLARRRKGGTAHCTTLEPRRVCIPPHIHIFQPRISTIGGWIGGAMKSIAVALAGGVGLDAAFAFAIIAFYGFHRRSFFFCGVWCGPKRYCNFGDEERSLACRGGCGVAEQNGWRVYEGRPVLGVTTDKITVGAAIGPRYQCPFFSGQRRGESLAAHRT